MGFFKLRKASAVVLALAMVVSPLNIQSETAYAAPKTIKSVSIKIGSKNVTKKTFKMTKGKSKKMKVLVKPVSSEKSVTFKSGNNKIVQVSKKGKLTAKKAGTAKVTVKVKDQKGQSKDTWVKIKVSKKEADTKPDVNEDNNTPVPEADKTSIPEINNTPAASAAPEADKTPVPETSSTPEASATPAASVTPEASATPSASAAPTQTGSPSYVGGVPSGGGSSSGGSSGGSSSTPEPDTVETKTITDSDSLLKELAKTSLPGKIIYNSDKEEKIELPDVKASNTSLVVNAPKATITNNAVFKDIQIEAIAPHTWFERAIGNRIGTSAKNPHISVGQGASVEQLDINTGAENVGIENDGIIRGISVSVSVGIEITGSNHTKIPFEATASAEGAVINTAIPLGVDTAANITLQLRLGAEQMTSVSIPSDAIKVILQGIGVIPVTNKGNGETNDIVASQPDGFDISDEAVSPSAITGKVYKAAESGTASLEGAHVYMLPYKDGLAITDADSIIAEAEKDGICKQTVTSADGTYEIKELKMGNYFLAVKADGLKDYIQTVILNREIYQNTDITMVDVSNATGSVEGKLFDAINGDSGVGAALLLEIRKGANNISGNPEKTYTLNPDTSIYKFEDLPIGAYTIYVKDTRENRVYNNATYTVTIRPDTTITQNMTISRIDTKYEGQLQFILEWLPETEDGSVSSDLDSHLVGPGAGEGEIFHTYFSNKEYYVNGERYADLDWDDTNYEGPETTTVRKEVDGVYHFYIHDFANSNVYNTKLTTSRPTVRVVVGTTPIATYSVPEGVGNIWDVCTYDTVTDTLTPVNKIYYYPDFGTLGNLSSAKSYLGDKMEEIKNNDSIKDNVNIISLLNEAQGILDTSGDFTEIAMMVSRLSGIEGATEISGADFTGKYDSYYSYTDNGVSVIELKGREETLPGDLKLYLKSIDAKYTITDSDKEEYIKAVVVENELLGISQKYYILYTQYIPEIELDNLQSITDENNYINSWDYAGKYIYIYGVAASLTNPVLVFGNEEVTYVYQPVTNNEDYTGKFTVSYKDYTREYFVKYSKEGAAIRLDGISEEGNVFDYISYAWEQDTDGNEYKVYYVNGYKEKLGTGTAAEGVTFKFNIEPSDVEVIPAAEENSIWDFTLEVTFMDEVQNLYVKYTQKNVNILPAEAYYTDEDGYEMYISIYTDSSAKQITLNNSSFSRWETLRFVSDYYITGVSYEVIDETDGSHSLSVKAGNTEIDRYTIILLADNE